MTAREVDGDPSTENAMSRTVTKNADSTSLSSDDNGTNEMYGQGYSQKNLQLPCMFWAVLAFSLFETITSMTFAQNATELAEQRFKGVFFIPCLGIFLDIVGHRASLCKLLLSMALADLVSSRTGSAVSLGVYSVVFNLGYTATTGGTRTNLWHQSVCGSAFSLKVTMNHAMSSIVRIITSALQDADNDSYRQIMQVYLVLSVFTVFVGIVILLSTFMTKQLAILQWARKKRLKSGDETSHVRKENSLLGHA
ncbi:Uncharacterized protein PECH_004294 [Penicillium ucsense]|uniref:Uncharacterized protein n=1 Tax=Penicillium ucsense TaxID=2839758 RepID=A0A8J8W664_9EURO|nr:Uncharacterized protein PECM_001143 [Penicillium ucsense]KAF7737179.1 Uncharacterized protein PECH_004294 [Penicillium ucsense]